MGRRVRVAHGLAFSDSQGESAMLRRGRQFWLDNFFLVREWRLSLGCNPERDVAMEAGSPAALSLAGVRILHSDRRRQQRTMGRRARRNQAIRRWEIHALPASEGWTVKSREATSRPRWQSMVWNPRAGTLASASGTDGCAPSGGRAFRRSRQQLN